MKKNIIILQVIILILFSGGIFQMSRGHKDYGQGQETKIIHSVSDMGELAARLGSPSTFQRSGNVIFQTDFEHGLADLNQYVMGTGAAIDLMGDRSFTKGISAKLTGGSDSGRRARLQKRLHSVETFNCGLEAAFAMDGNVSYFALSIELHDGEDRYLFQVFGNIEDKELQYYDDTGNKVKIVSDTWGGGELDTWHIMKMIIDLKNKKYLGVFSNAEYYNLLGISGYTNIDTGDASLQFNTWTLSQEGKNGIVYVDNIILTINEP